MSRKRVIATLAVVAVVLVVAAVAVTAQEDTSGNQLAGTWVVTLPRPAPLRPLIVLQHWNADGTYLSYSGNGTLGDSPAGRSNEFGSWERIEGRLYASSGSWLRYDTQTGAHIGSNRADRTIRDETAKLGTPRSTRTPTQKPSARPGEPAEVAGPPADRLVDDAAATPSPDRPADAPARDGATAPDRPEPEAPTEG